MDFIGIGLPELVVILILTLIVVGPKRLPEMAAQIARTIREIRRYSAGVTRELNEAVKDLEHEYDGLKGEWRAVGEEMRKSTAAISGELTGAAEEARKGLQLEAPEPQATPEAKAEPEGNESTDREPKEGT